MQMVQHFLSTPLVRMQTNSPSDHLSSPTQIGSSPNRSSSSDPPSSPFTCVGAIQEELLSDKMDQSALITINTKFDKELNAEFKPGRRASKSQIVALTNAERELAEEATIPTDIDDFAFKVCI
jgi:hypothetical protein